MSAERGRLLAIDWGERRIGLAISDPTGTIASPAGYILRRPGKRPPLAEIIRRATELEARGFVVGLPLDELGDDTPRATEVRRVAEELASRTGMTARLVDERFTTAAARRTVHEMGGKLKGRKGDIDALSATVLLQHALRFDDAVPPEGDA
ncbi:MAG: Holliday junction resolvase [Gemmatimonadetes bacterium]|nr:Holliday junction resolvase [Gemmatimonadota bacterium]